MVSIPWIRFAVSHSYNTRQNTGVVNVYNTASLTPTVRAPKASKALLNLTTTISNLAFHPSSQIMAYSSKVKKDQLKLVHFPSMTVYSNWPKATTPLGHVTGMEFSPRGEFLAVGNDKGKVGLWRVIQ